MLNNKWAYYLFFLLPFIVSAVALFIGTYKISPSTIIDALIHKDFHTPEGIIIFEIRMPRIILSSLVGIALSVSGATLQGIFRNPLVDPYILGISGGAAFGCALCVGFLSEVPIQVMAFCFGIVAVVLAYLIAGTHGEISRFSLILAGIIISSFFQALVCIVKFLVDPHKLQSIVFWLMGSFSLSDWKKVQIAATGIILGIIPVFLMRWRLNVISMGDEEAKALGIDINRDRVLFIVFSTIAIAVATSVSGIIGWIGLMVPHIIRMIYGPDHRRLIPMSIAGGATFMIIADTLSRSLTSFDIPVGIITALSGAPFFIFLMKKGEEIWGNA